MTFLIFQTRSDENKLQLSEVKTFTPAQENNKNSFYQTSWCPPEYTDYLTVHINTGYLKFRNLAIIISKGPEYIIPVYVWQLEYP